MAKTGRLGFVLVLVFVFIFSSIANATWKKGKIHLHSNFSDGTAKPAQNIDRAKKEGCDFLVATDHYDKINDLKHRLLGGFKNYQKEYQTDKLVTIVGAEIKSKMAKTTSHTLALGDIQEDSQIENLSNEGKQQELINYLREKKYLAVAAHPHFKEAGYSLSYDKDQAEGIDGVEFFNDSSDKGYRETLFWYLGLVFHGKNVFPIGGCDSHSTVDVNQRESRKTYVDVDDSEKDSKKAILDGLRAGRVYAAQYGCKIEPLNFSIGHHKTSEVSRPRFKFKITFEKPVSSDKEINLYRDWNYLGTVGVIKKGEKEKLVDCQDNSTRVPKVYNYTVEVRKCLLTAPIRIKVTAAKAKLEEPVYDCYYDLVMVKSDPFKLEGDIKRSNSDEWPVKMSQVTDTFTAPAKISFYVLMKNKLNPAKNELIGIFCQIKIYDSSGRKVDESYISMFSGSYWRIGWMEFRRTIYEPGEYTIKLNSQERKEFAQKKFWVKKGLF